MAKKAKKATKKPRTSIQRKSRHPKQLPRQPTVLVSTNNGNTHIFDTNGLYTLEESILGKKAFIDAADLKTALVVSHTLNQVKPLTSWITTSLSTPLYRIVDGDVDPLESKYTLAAGGRVNVGMAQVVPQLSTLKATEGVYASFDKTTAIVEYTSGGLPLTSVSTGYELRLSQSEPCKFIDFDAAVTFLAAKIPSVNLIAIVSETPFAAYWKYQKVPKSSQIIGDWLIASFQAQNVEFDGLAFRSTKNPVGTNAFIVTPSSWIAEATQVP